MPSSTETRTEDKQLEGAFSAAVTGYSMIFKCEHARGCENEVEWFGNQHNCYRAYLCDMHMTDYYLELLQGLMEDGFILCRKCRLAFKSIDQFCAMVKV